jgi:hypothetical protein
MSSFLLGLRTSNVRIRKYCKVISKDHIVVGMKARPPTLHALSSPIQCESVLARARKPQASKNPVASTGTLGDWNSKPISFA